MNTRVRRQRTGTREQRYILFSVDLLLAFAVAIAKASSSASSEVAEAKPRAKRAGRKAKLEATDTRETLAVKAVRGATLARAERTTRNADIGFKNSLRQKSLHPYSRGLKFELHVSKIGREISKDQWRMTSKVERCAQTAISPASRNYHLCCYCCCRA
jgi:hypothetical protein